MPTDPEPHRDAALSHEQAAEIHERSAAFWEGQGNPDRAGLQRQLAEYERRGAGLERALSQLTDPGPADHVMSDAEQAMSRVRRNAEHLSSLLNRTADALETTAALADAHALRREQAGLTDAAGEERRVADRARESAQRARSQAEVWLKRGLQAR